MGHFIKAAKIADIATGKLRCVEIEGKRIALFSLGDQIYALGDLLEHPRATPLPDDVERYNVRVQDDDIEIELEESPAIP